jgi:hypothetical protein
LLTGFLYMHLNEPAPTNRELLDLERAIVASAFKLIIPG